MIPKIAIVASLLMGLLSFSKVISQSGLINNGAQIVIEQGAFIHATMDVTNANQTGFYDGKGTIVLHGDWKNVSGNPGFFTGNEITTQFKGGNQLIHGTSETIFYNLTLEGMGVKEVDGSDISVSNILNLNDQELRTGQFNVTLESTDPNKLIRTSGYISSTGSGRFTRAMANSGVYLYPLGSSLPMLYRPLEVKPNGNGLHKFSARLVDDTPSNDGYSTSLRDTGLCSVNSGFYHILEKVSGANGADITVYLDSIQDGPFDEIAHWDAEWKPTGANMPIYTNGLSKIETIGWQDFQPGAFALAQKNPLAQFTYQVLMDTISFSNTSSGNIQSWLWDFGDGDSSVMESPTHAYDTSITSTFEVCLTATTASGCSSQSCQQVSFVPLVVGKGIPDLEISVFPNPAHDFLNIGIVSSFEAEASVDILDLHGRTVQSQYLGQVGSTLVRLPVDKLASSIYFIRLKIEENEYFKKTVIRH